MGSIFLGKVLMSTFEQPAKSPADAELDPIVPGAWAAWARANAGEQVARAAATPATPAERVPDPRAPTLATGPHHG